MEDRTIPTCKRSGPARATRLLAALLLGSALLAPMGGARASVQPDAMAAAPATSFSAVYLGAFHAAASNDPARAADLYLRAMEHDPDNEDLIRRAYYYLTLSGRVHEAAEQAAKVVTLDSDGIIAHLLLVTDALGNDKYNDAAFLLKSLPARPYSGFVQHLLTAWSLVGTTDLDRAYKALSPLSDEPQAEILYHYHAGLIAERMGDIKHADAHLLLLEAGLGSHPLSVIDTLTAYYHRQGNTAKAATLIADYEAANPEAHHQAAGRLAELKARLDGPPPPMLDARHGAAEALFSLSRAFLAAERDEMAQIFGHMGQYLAPENEGGERLVIHTLIASQRFAEAYNRLEGLAEASADPLPLRLQAAEMLDLMDRREEAVALVKSLARAYPDMPDPLVTKADLYRREMRFDDAVQAYDAAFSLLDDPEKASWSLYYARGVVLERARNWPRAEDDFRKALTLSPKNPMVLNYLGYSLLDRGEKIAEAREMVEDAARLRPHDGMIVDSLGWAMFVMGEFDDAVIQLERAVELEPLDPAITDHLGDAYWAVGRRLEARFQWQRALDMEPEDELAVEIRTKLREGLALNLPETATDPAP